MPATIIVDEMITQLVKYKIEFPPLEISPLTFSEDIVEAHVAAIQIYRCIQIQKRNKPREEKFDNECELLISLLSIIFAPRDISEDLPNTIL